MLLHGGSVSARSDGAGRGSEILISLPLVHLESGTPEAEGGADGLGRDETGLRILVVDDNVDAADTLGMLLEAMGHNVQVEHHPVQALSVAAGFAPEVCLLDIGLPEMNGNELARRLRLMPQLERTTFVAVSGYGQPQDRQESLAAGFQHHFVKPVEGAQMLALLRSLTIAESLPA